MAYWSEHQGSKPFRCVWREQDVSKVPYRNIGDEGRCAQLLLCPGRPTFAPLTQYKSTCGLYACCICTEMPASKALADKGLSLLWVRGDAAFTTEESVCSSSGSYVSWSNHSFTQVRPARSVLGLGGRAGRPHPLTAAKGYLLCLPLTNDPYARPTHRYPGHQPPI